jgi:hypothetical protein
MDEEKPRVPGHDRAKVTGVTLIIVGLALFVLQFFEGVGESLFFFVIGAAFLAMYARRKEYGFLVPAGIMMGLGLGFIVDSSSLGLGIGFLSIYVIDTVVRGPSHWWPLIPGLILVLKAVTARYDDFGAVVSRGWPLILVIVGVLYLMGVIGKKRDTEFD